MNRLPQNQRWKDPFPGDWALIDKYACARNVAELHKGPCCIRPSSIPGVRVNLDRNVLAWVLEFWVTVFF
jgi:hypothetical protein